MRNLKLYLWTEVLTDYSHGVMFAIAYNIDEARALIKKQDNFYCNCIVEDEDTCDYCSDLKKQPKVIEAPFAYVLHGGG